MVTNIGKVLRTAEVAYAALRSSEVIIDCFGNQYSRGIFEKFSAPHPRLPLFGFKTLGVALRDMNVPSSELFAGSHFELMRRKVRKAEKQGYALRTIAPADHVAEILAINRSAEVRQQRSLPSCYTDEAEVRHYNEQPGTWFGVFDRDGVLRAYCHTPVAGNYFLYSTLLGEGTRLNDGIMYFMIRETVRLMHEQFLRQGYPRWAMYDTYIGAPEGLREFKRRTGFLPMRVKWRWVEPASAPYCEEPDTAPIV